MCGGAEKRLVFRQQFSPIDGASLFDGYDVVVCTACGFAFADDIPSQATLDAYYRDLSKYEYDQRGGQESSFDLARFRRHVAEFREFIPGRDARILEIGCSTGGLLSILRTEGFTNVCGLDPSPACARAADRLYGIPVTAGTLADSAALDGAADFLVAIGLLEHVRDLGAALARMRSLLRGAGQIFVEVPDALQFAAHRDAPFQQFSVEHIDFFSARSLENLLGASGLERVRIWRTARQHSQGCMMPVISGVFRATGTRKPAIRDDEGYPALLAYIEKSKSVDARLHAVIDELTRSRRPILVWGVGTHTQRLLATSRLGEATIVAFVDSNANYWSHTLVGKPILGPEDVRGRTEPILISSLLFQEEISRQVRDELRLPNELLRLYDV